MQQISIPMLWKLCLVRLRQTNHLVRVRKISCSGSQYLVLLTQTCLEGLLKGIQFRHTYKYSNADLSYNHWLGSDVTPLRSRPSGKMDAYSQLFIPATGLGLVTYFNSRSCPGAIGAGSWLPAENSRTSHLEFGSLEFPSDETKHIWVESRD